jgi:sialic acid synthase SpsE
MTEKIVLDHCIISPDEQTFIMAEIGINHGGLIDTFFKYRQ